MAQENITQRKVKILTPQSNIGGFSSIKINNQTYKANVCSDGEDPFYYDSFITNINFNGNSCELNCTFYFGGIVEKEVSISKKIYFTDINKKPLEIYFDIDGKLDTEKNKGNLIAKNKLNPILKIFLKVALIALLFSAAIAISVLTFVTGAIPLTLLGTALATKIGIGIATSILIGIGLFFSVKFIFNDCKRKNNKYEKLNDKNELTSTELNQNGNEQDKNSQSFNTTKTKPNQQENPQKSCLLI